MEKLTNKIRLFIIWGKWLVAIIAGLWFVFGVCYKYNEDMKVIQKSTLRNTIWNENIPMHDRLESCDSYLALGYNSETKKFCNKLLERGD